MDRRIILFSIHLLYACSRRHRVQRAVAAHSGEIRRAGRLRAFRLFLGLTKQIDHGTGRRIRQSRVPRVAPAVIHRTAVAGAALL